MTTDNYGMGLFPQHAEMLAASGISPERARARRYRSIDTKVSLEQYKVTQAGRRVPGLLVPMLRVDGSEWGYQYRPDSPRERDGKPVKYETPTGQRNGIDFPPGVRDMLADLTTPLWVTEGVKKADSAVQRGLACIALPGVWSWKGKPGKAAHESTVAVADWDDVGLKGRGVVLAFDSDVMVKPAVRAALERLAAYLTMRGAAEVRYLLLPDEGDGKPGLDDFLAVHDVQELGQHVRKELPPPEREPAPKPSAGSAASAGPAGSGGDPLHRGIELAEDVHEDGAALLEEVRAWLARHITVMKPSDLDVLTLWAAHTHLSTALFTTPRLQIDSPVPESGKTTVLEHLERLTYRAVMASSISSAPLLARLVGSDPRTLLLDEVDRTLDPKKDGVGELVAILNSGYKVGGSRPTLVPVKGGDWEAVELSTFAPVVLAGNQPALPDDTRTRIIRVLLLPDWQGRAEESDWELKEEPASMLGARLARWARHARPNVAYRPEMPPGVTSRFREKWQPLARVAYAAGGRWLAAVMELAAADVEQVRLDREEGLAVEKPAVLLLRHIINLWPPGEPFWATTQLVDTLVMEHPEVWGDESNYGKALTPQRLGRMLNSAYGIRSTREDTAEKNSTRGYRRDHFGEATEALTARAAGSHPTGTPPPPEPAELSEPAEPAEPGPTGPLRCTECGNVLHRGECIRCLTTAAVS